MDDVQVKITDLGEAKCNGCGAKSGVGTEAQLDSWILAHDCDTPKVAPISVPGFLISTPAHAGSQP